MTSGDPTCGRAAKGTAYKVFWVGEQLCRVTVACTQSQLGVEVEWGEGTTPLQELQVRALLGLEDSPRFEPPIGDPLHKLSDSARRIRLVKVPWFYDAVLQTVLHQRVSGSEAGQNWSKLCRRYGTVWEDCWSAPAPKVLLTLSGAQLAACGIEEKRAIPLREAAFRLGAPPASGAPLSDYQSRMAACRRVGQWTNAMVRGFFLADPDAVPLGDYNLPHMVGYFFRGERRSSDSQMLLDLEPYSGQRFRVIRWLKAGGVRVPRRGPRMAMGRGIGE